MTLQVNVCGPASIVTVAVRPSPVVAVNVAVVVPGGGV